MELSELLTVETEVLRTFCLSVNSESSELNERITEELVVDSFYFPITKSIFDTVTALSKSGMNVDPNSLQQALTLRSVDVPDDFFLEDLFRGEAPSVETLTEWIDGLSSRNGNGDELADAAPPGPPGKDHYLEKTHPSVKLSPAAAAAPAPEPASVAEASAPLAPAERAKSPEPAEEPRLPREAAAAKPARPAEEPATTKPTTPSVSNRAAKPSPAPSSSPTKNPPKKATQDVLAPESGEWLGYLAELTKKQGEHLKTGFAGLDAEWGGLGTGLLLLAGDERYCLVDFLKQLVDQIAIRCRVPCLYLSFERSKAELRLHTLSRLSEAPATHIRDGRYDKTSAEWQSIIRAGEQAVEWLQRIYTVEAAPGLAVTGIRELRQGLIDSGAGATCMIAIDNLQKLASKSDLLQSVAELKELAESLGIVVIGVADNMELVHERSADMAVKFSETDGVSVLEVHTAGNPTPTELRFDYRREIHRFDERL
jgi:hypothetical protein